MHLTQRQTHRRGQEPRRSGLRADLLGHGWNVALYQFRRGRHQDRPGHARPLLPDDHPHAKGSRSLNHALPPIGAAGRCGRIDESVGKEFPQRLGDPVAVEAAAGILRGTSRCGRSSPPSQSLRYRTGRHSHRGARLIGASSACPPPRCGIWWNPASWVGVHGGSHRGESQP